MTNSDLYIHLNVSDLRQEEESEDSWEKPLWVMPTLHVLYSLICIVGLGGNTLVIFMISRFTKMKTVTNLYILNLAIADELYLIFMPLIVITMRLGYWPFGNWACKGFYTSTSINQMTSSFFLLVLAADRYLVLCHPITASNWRTQLMAKLIIFATWTFSICLMIPIFMYAKTVDMNGQTNCNIFWPESGTISGSSIFIVYSFVLGLCLPFTLITIFYTLIIWKMQTFRPTHLLTSSGQVTVEPGQLTYLSEEDNIRKKTNRKVTKLVLILITVYFVCWFPFWTLQIGLLFDPPGVAHSVTKVFMFLVASGLSYANSAVNPILYAFLSKDFKKSFCKTFNWICKPINPTELNQREGVSDDDENPMILIGSTIHLDPLTAEPSQNLSNN